MGRALDRFCCSHSLQDGLAVGLDLDGGPHVQRMRAIRIAILIRIVGLDELE